MVSQRWLHELSLEGIICPAWCYITVSAFVGSRDWLREGCSKVATAKAETRSQRNKNLYNRDKYPSSYSAMASRPGHSYSNIYNSDNSRNHFGDAYYHYGPPPDQQAFQAVLDSLRYDGMDDRLNRLDSAERGTFEWALAGGDVETEIQQYEESYDDGEADEDSGREGQSDAEDNKDGEREDGSDEEDGYANDEELASDGVDENLFHDENKEEYMTDEDEEEYMTEEDYAEFTDDDNDEKDAYSEEIGNVREPLVKASRNG